MSLTERSPVSTLRPFGLLLAGAEPLLLQLFAGALTLFVGLAVWSGQAVDWSGIGLALGPALALILLGIHLRARRGRPRLAVLLVGVGFYAAFGNLVGCLIYLRFPLGGPTPDPFLVRLDGMLGYDWATGVAWLAYHPVLSDTLALVYQSALWQLLALLSVLALSGRVRDLYGLLLTGALSLLLTVAVWWAAPTLGPATLAPDLAQSLVVDGAYAAELLRLATQGTPVLRPDAIIGTIAFPSYHLVMAALVARFAWGTPLRVPALLLALATIPATLLHGGHHLMDLLGGAAVFAIAHRAATWLLRSEKEGRSGLPERPLSVRSMARRQVRPSDAR